MTDELHPLYRAYLDAEERFQGQRSVTLMGLADEAKKRWELAGSPIEAPRKMFRYTCPGGDAWDADIIVGDRIRCPRCFGEWPREEFGVKERRRTDTVAPAVVSLAEKRLEPHPDVVATLEELLVEAKAGKIRGVAVAYDYVEGKAGWAYGTGDAKYAQLHLELCILQRKMEELAMGGDLGPLNARS